MQAAQLGDEHIGHLPSIFLAALLCWPLQHGSGQAEDGVCEPAVVGAEEVGVQPGQLVQAPQGRVPGLLGDSGHLDVRAECDDLGVAVRFHAFLQAGWAGHESESAHADEGQPVSLGFFGCRCCLTWPGADLQLPVAR